MSIFIVMPCWCIQTHDLNQTGLEMKFTLISPQFLRQETSLCPVWWLPVITSMLLMNESADVNNSTATGYQPISSFILVMKSCDTSRNPGAPSHKYAAFCHIAHTCAYTQPIKTQLINPPPNPGKKRIHNSSAQITNEAINFWSTFKEKHAI